MTTTTRHAFTLTIMRHPNPLTITCTYLEAGARAHSLAAASGQPVFLSWLENGARHEQRFTASSRTPAEVRV